MVVTGHLKLDSCVSQPAVLLVGDPATEEMHRQRLAAAGYDLVAVISEGDLPSLTPAPVVRLRGGVEVHLDEPTAYRDGVLLDLSPHEYGVLRVLALADGRIVTSADLLIAVWQHRNPVHADIALLHTVMSRLRRKLEQDPAQPDCVRTVRGRGYLAPSGRAPASSGDRQVRPAGPG